MARTFNGSTDIITTGNTAAAVLRSCSFWFYPTATPSGTPVFYEWRSFVDGTLNDLASFLDTLFLYEAGFDGNLGLWEFGDGTFPSLNQWHHLCITFDGSNVANVPFALVDGVDQSATMITALPPAGTAIANNYPIVFGNDAGPNPYTGYLAEFGFWNCLLATKELTALSKGIKPNRIRPASLKAYYPLWGLQSPEPDLSGNKNSAVLTGTTRANHAPVNEFTAV